MDNKNSSPCPSNDSTGIREYPLPEEVQELILLIRNNSNLDCDSLINILILTELKKLNQNLRNIDLTLENGVMR
jgi:hypothetical protein